MANFVDNNQQTQITQDIDSQLQGILNDGDEDKALIDLNLVYGNEELKKILKNMKNPDDLLKTVILEAIRQCNAIEPEHYNNAGIHTVIIPHYSDFDQEILKKFNKIFPYIYIDITDKDRVIDLRKHQGSHTYKITYRCVHPDQFLVLYTNKDLSIINEYFVLEDNKNNAAQQDFKNNLSHLFSSEHKDYNENVRSSGRGVKMQHYYYDTKRLPVIITQNGEIINYPDGDPFASLFDLLTLINSDILDEQFLGTTEDPIFNINNYLDDIKKTIKNDIDIATEEKIKNIKDLGLETEENTIAKLNNLRNLIISNIDNLKTNMLSPYKINKLGLIDFFDSFYADFINSFDDNFIGRLKTEINDTVINDIERLNSLFSAMKVFSNNIRKQIEIEKENSLINDKTEDLKKKRGEYESKYYEALINEQIDLKCEVNILKNLIHNKQSNEHDKLKKLVEAVFNINTAKDELNKIANYNFDNKHHYRLEHFPKNEKCIRYLTQKLFSIEDFSNINKSDIIKYFTLEYRIKIVKRLKVSTGGYMNNEDFSMLFTKEEFDKLVNDKNDLFLGRVFTENTNDDKKVDSFMKIAHTVLDNFKKDSNINNTNLINDQKNITLPPESSPTEVTKMLLEGQLQREQQFINKLSGNKETVTGFSLNN